MPLVVIQSQKVGNCGEKW